MATFGWWQWLLTAVLLVAVVSAGLFAVRTARYAMYWSQHRNEPIEAWMTLRYVAKSYGVPPEELRAAIDGNDDLRRFDRRPLGRIAEERGQSFEELRAAVEAAIVEVRAREPASTRPGAPPPKGSPASGGAPATP